MTDTPVIEEVVPGSADDPFTKASATPASPSPSPAGGTGADAASGAETVVDASATTVDPASTTVVEDTDEELSPDEEAAISVLIEQIRAEVRTEELPKVQSAYDRRIAALDRSATAAAQAAAVREQALQAQVREAQLNGLSDEEKTRLRSEWNLVDETAKVDAYRQEVEAYHKEVYILDCVAQFGTELGITADDLVDFNSPEEIEAFIKDSALAHYRDLAAGRTVAPVEAKPAATKPVSAATATPAGLDAASDGGAGSAVPSVVKFDPRPGKDAMLNNIKNGAWETVKVG